MGATNSKDEETFRRRKVDLAKQMIKAYFEDMENRKDIRVRNAERLEHQYSYLGEEEKKIAKKEAMKKLMSMQFVSRRRMTVSEFHIIRRIGKGSFGEVFLVVHKPTRKHYAMKKLSKERMLAKGQVRTVDFIIGAEQVAHAWVERYALTRAGRHPNVVELYFCFQDLEYLYLIMEYVPGGDMLTMLTREKTLSEEWARFYLAELVVAIDALHVEGIIHRDIKPDNVLFGTQGHIRLSDFGLSKALHLERLHKWKCLSRHQAFSTVGTPNYIAPEVLLTGRYDETSDWWSLGIILYEMLIGYPPFWSGSAAGTCRKIIGWKDHLKFPSDVKISPEAEDLIRNLICAPVDRLGRTSGVAEFEEHPFFRDKIDFEELPTAPAPFVPELRTIEDTRYFDSFSEEDEDSSEDRTVEDSPTSDTKINEYRRTFRRRLLSDAGKGDLDFAGYSYMNLTIALDGIPMDCGPILPEGMEEDDLIRYLGPDAHDQRESSPPKSKHGKPSKWMEKVKIHPLPPRLKHAVVAGIPIDHVSDGEGECAETHTDISSPLQDKPFEPQSAFGGTMDLDHATTAQSHPTGEPVVTPDLLHTHAYEEHKGTTIET